jgi:hypothetical protein
VFCGRWASSNEKSHETASLLQQKHHYLVESFVAKKFVRDCRLKDELKGPLDSVWVNRLVKINNFDNDNNIGLKLLSFASCSNDNKIIIWKQQQSTALKFESSIQMMVEPQQDYHIKSLVYLKETNELVYGTENGQVIVCSLSSFDNDEKKNNKDPKQRIQTSSNVLSLCKISKDVGQKSRVEVAFASGH